MLATSVAHLFSVGSVVHSVAKQAVQSHQPASDRDQPKCDQQTCDQQLHDGQMHDQPKRRGRLRLTVLALLLCRIFVPTSAWGQDTVPDATRPRPAKVARAAVIEMQGEINGQLTTYFNGRFEQARQAGVDLLIIEIDSPGGLKIESLQMARTLRDCKWAYTVAVIANEAISGAALISLGCDEIFIDPNAKFGDIGEIGFDTEAFAWRLIEPKIESYLSRDARDLAESKGRPADLAEAMVDKDVLIYARPQDDNADADTFDFQAVRSDAEVKPDLPWQLVQETGPERFLTLSGQRAKALGIAQAFAASTDEVTDVFELDAAKIRRFRYTTTDSFVHHLNQPFLTGVLILVGLTALYLELSAPGIGVGGLVSGLCALLFFWSRFLSGTSGWLEVILFAMGITCIALELFVIPGFGLPGLLGILLLFVSVLMASQNFVIPETNVQWNQLTTSSLVMLTSGLLFLVVAVFISRRLGSLPFLNRLVLAGPDADRKGAPAADAAALSDGEVAITIGDLGTTESVLRPAGRAQFGGRSINVVSDGSYIDVGQQVRVVKVAGNIVKVTEM